jgi:hypothetical protein
MFDTPLPVDILKLSVATSTLVHIALVMKVGVEQMVVASLYTCGLQFLSVI